MSQTLKPKSHEEMLPPLKSEHRHNPISLLLLQLAIYGNANWLLMPLMLSLLLTGCGLLSHKPEPDSVCTPPVKIQAPVPTTPQPQESYSTSAQRDIQTWQQKLMAILPTSKP